MLVTELRGRAGLVRVTDAPTLRAGADPSEDAPAGRRELLRSVRVLEGRVRSRVEIAPRGGAEAERRHGGWRVRWAARPELDLRLDAGRPLAGLRSTHELAAGDALQPTLRSGQRTHRYQPFRAEDRLRGTLDAWRAWLGAFAYGGPQPDLVRRSAVTLKPLNHVANGPMVAAPTSSLPEAIGGPRNWDYRDVWIRDAAFAVYALRRVGLGHEADGFLGWVLDAAERDGRPRVLSDLDGNPTPPEREDPGLAGYRGSAPVRWGNGAAEQIRHDVSGEVLDCAYLWAMHGGIDAAL